MKDVSGSNYPKVKPLLAVARYVSTVRRPSHVCRKLVAFCLVFLLPRICEGTVIVVINDGTNIWVGTDSLQSNATKTAMRFACKINKGRAFHWAVATPIVADTATGFDFSHLVMKSDPRGNLNQKMAIFIRKSGPPLATELAAIKKKSPDFFAAVLTYKALFQVLFIGLDSGRPSFRWIILNAQESKGKIKIVSTEPDGDPSNPGVFSMGEGQVARAYILAHIPDSPITLLRNGIAAQEAATPEMVNGPISIAKIDRTGFTWIDKGECP